MREIKFRAFDRRTGRMVQSGVQFNNTTMELECIPDLILMQFTGLKDKAGMEICEGDVLRIIYEYPLALKGKCHTGEVAWDDKEACFYVGGYDHSIPYGEANVIGNIWENPELVRGAK